MINTSNIPALPDLRKHAGRPKGLHYHYKYGKQEMLLSIDEIVNKVRSVYLSIEHEAFFWLIYYTGARKSEIYELPTSSFKLSDTHLIVDIGQRKKHSAKTKSIELKRVWYGVDKIVKLYEQRSVFRATKKKLVRFSKNFSPDTPGLVAPDKQIITQVDKWMFLNVSPSTAISIFKQVLGKEYYPHFGRLLRLSEIGTNPQANIVMMKSFSGIKSSRSLEAYIGQSEKQLRAAEQLIDAEQIKIRNDLANAEVSKQ